MSTYITTRRRAICLASTLFISSMTLAAVAAKASTFHPGQAPSGERQGLQAIDQSNTTFWDALVLEPPGFWEVLRQRFAWQDQIDHPRVQEWIDHYQAHPESIADIIKRSRPWMHWITSRVEARGLPGEIALLPFIESAYDPMARSHRGASGLWQFMPRTGDALGLTRTHGYDGRLDVVAATEAALDYLEGQAAQWYEGDMELSLAAYNAGAGTVNRARRDAAGRGEPTDYWHLRLPGETMDYVPKLLAISAIINDPDRYALSLPTIDNTPTVAAIEVDVPLSLERLAQMANVSVRRLKSLNPGHLDGFVDPAYTPELVVPAGAKDTLLANLDGVSTGTVRYVVRRGDNLSAIANLHNVSLASLRQRNGLNGDMIRAGQTLYIPNQTILASN
ncbi:MULTISPECIES: transglycosylase SLT domain-containing protein [Halomonadaceae]|uniref:transglycosylase SLT domain-containing protein n=1 Tax=Halomonadaceae TaxID=28256 RepID=UPI001582D4A3|nr:MULTISPECIES: transglycosylase SLT domain-containing protein [Halomonas]MDI4638266.1 transglycosylase SLT domain-containing protein [Halomonas sp. BMC7]NUJ59257.1 transglycosylase SLT domain-containing protein [Halomonas taeanensis]|tara:strand:- start:83343 stop:84518 length:1176 start_codon:yes stop_codon:yes gene_type:complete